MIAPVVAAFLAGVFAVLGFLFWDDLRRAAKHLDPRAPRPWKTITSANGSTELTGGIMTGPMGVICSELLVATAADPSLTSGITMNTPIEGRRYKVFVSWKMVFTVDPEGTKP